MQQVGTALYVGDFQAAGDHARYEDAAITDVVRLTFETPGEEGADGDGYPDHVAVHAHPMMDGPRNDPEQVHDAVETTVTRLSAGGRVLVHCSVGASRSVAVATAARAVVTNESFETALVAVREATTVNLHPTVRSHAEDAVAALGQ